MKRFSTIDTNLKKIYDSYMKIRNSDLIREPSCDYPIAINKVSVALYKLILEEYEKNIQPILSNQQYQQLIGSTLQENEISIKKSEPKTTLVLEKKWMDFDIQFEIKEFELKKDFNIFQNEDEEFWKEFSQSDDSKLHKKYVLKTDGKYIIPDKMSNKIQKKSLRIQFKGDSRPSIIFILIQFFKKIQKSSQFQVTQLISNIISEVLFEKIKFQKSLYQGVYFYSLPPQLQQDLIELIESSFLKKNMVKGLYMMALHYEIQKYIDLIKNLMEFNAINFDKGILQQDIQQ